MRIGMIALGRMGTSIVRRPIRAGDEGLVFDVSPQGWSLECLQARARESGEQHGAGVDPVGLGEWRRQP